MSDTIAQTVGVDISKDVLDAHRHPEGVARQFTNDARGFAALIAWLGERPVTRVVFEPTGPTIMPSSGSSAKLVCPWSSPLGDPSAKQPVAKPPEG